MIKVAFRLKEDRMMCNGVVPGQWYANTFGSSKVPVVLDMGEPWFLHPIDKNDHRFDIWEVYWYEEEDV